TLLISLTFYFIVLYMMFLTAGLVLLPPDYILQNIGAKEVGIWFYLELAWFATSLSTVVGAIGAGFQDKSIIQESTYGYRQRFRFQKQDKG
ncbi:MAG TPA: 5,10-methylene-tetrahydrofolate dehydrogenase, partial [Candidatus Dormibacteraeota bacterium]|nr:5,10-methylene-tetrahydrofolate dehydrogenase [Candidatus Dormibacteraeota bacterium]